jgi:hypothetical protein
LSDFDKRLVRVLLRIAQSPDERFSASAVLDHFCEDFSIGKRRGKGWDLTEQDKEAVRAVLRAAGIDPGTAPSAWDGLARADALQLGRNEKFTTGPVQCMRVAVKTLPCRRLRIVGQDLWLPRGCHLDAPAELVASTSLHSGILFVENWENFERIHECTLDLADECYNPLVVWRGEKEGTRTDAALWLVRNLVEPVWAFVDYDPSGLLIAARLPRLRGVIAPPDDVLERDLAEGIRDRYEDQLPGAAAALDACEHKEIRRLWEILRRHGRALPQERYLRAGGS